MLTQGRYGGRGEQAVSCTCTARTGKNGGRPRYEPIEARTRFPAADAIAAWRAWHAERGVVV
jgi:hypothetical protein